jgi:hypothetical protein
MYVRDAVVDAEKVMLRPDDCSTLNKLVTDGLQMMVAVSSELCSHQISFQHNYQVYNNTTGWLVQNDAEHVFLNMKSFSSIMKHTCT